MMHQQILGFAMSVCVLSAVSCGGSVSRHTEIELENTSEIRVSDYPIKISSQEFPKMSERLFPLLRNQLGDTLAVQLDDNDGDGVWDELFFVADIDANQRETFSLAWTPDSIPYTYKTRVRHGVRTSLQDVVHPSDSGEFLPDQLPHVTGFQPFQTDGPSWENDMVGFRHYLDGRNSKDVFGKRSAELSPRHVGINTQGVTEDNYHVMEDWGRDIMAVGNSIGLGGVSLLIGTDSLYRMGSIEGDTLGPIDRTIFRIYAEGPVRSILDFQYQGWKLHNGRKYDARETVEIWPGIYGYKSTVSYSGIRGDEHLIVSLVNSRTEKPLKEVFANDDWVILSTHDKQTYEKEWYLGLALILPRGVYEGYINAPSTGRIATSYLAKLAIKDQTPISYYSIACWELRDSAFRSEAFFDNYLRNVAAQLSAKITVTIHDK